MLHKKSQYSHLTLIPTGLPGHLYRSALPFSQYDPEGLILKQYLQANIKNVIVLVEKKEAFNYTQSRNILQIYQDNWITPIHFPIPNYGVADSEEMHHLVQKIIDLLQQGNNIAIHCFAGVGRTGTLAACLLKKINNQDGQEAIKNIRKLIPGAVETAGQEDFVKQF
ncbi:MAG: dual specificity protein phosphatase family protein [Spirochaetes bacterium]|nr:dual specificity protein phosphatase family protein [Spirochaetota bacterium]